MLANVRPLLRKPRISNDLAFKLTGFWHALNQLVLQSLVVSLGVVIDAMFFHEGAKEGCIGEIRCADRQVKPRRNQQPGQDGHAMLQVNSEMGSPNGKSGIGCPS